MSKSDSRFPHHNTPTPVAGVVLLVAISVLIGSVTVVYLLELGSGATSVGPITAVEFDFDQNATGPDDFGTAPGDFQGHLRVTVVGGDSVSADQLYLQGAASLDGRRSWAASMRYGPSSRVAAGSTLSVWASRADSVRLIWVSEAGDRSAIVDRWDGPDS